MSIELHGGGGLLCIEVRYHSGAGVGHYSLMIKLSSAEADIGSTVFGDAGAFDVRQQGVSLLDGWSSSGGYWSGSGSSTMLLNLYDDTYQMNTDYLVTFGHYSGASVTVQIYNGFGWIDIGTLEGKTADSSASIVVPCEHFYDSLPDVQGMNVKLRFVHALQLYSVHFVSYSHTVDASDIGSENIPGITFEGGWSENGGTISGASGATLLISVPKTEIAYILKFQCPSGTTLELQQRTSSGYISLGTTSATGSAAFLLNSNYYDAEPSKAGMNVRLKVLSPLQDLSSITLYPAQYVRDVGVYGDIDAVENMLGVSIVGDGYWGPLTEVDDKTVRQTTNDQAGFLLNSVVSGTDYIITMNYRATNPGGVYVHNGASWILLGVVNNDGQWRSAEFRLDPAQFHDSRWPYEINIRFKLTSDEAYVDWMKVSIDSDGDQLSDAFEADRVGNAYGLDPFSAGTDSDGLNDKEELSAGTDPTNPDTDNDGLLDGSERWSQTWSTDDSPKIPDIGAISTSIFLPKLTSTVAAPITGLNLYLGIDHTWIGDLYITVSHAGRSAVLWNRQGGSGDHIYRSYDLLNAGFIVSDLASTSAWTLTVQDQAGGDDGRLAYFRIQVDGATNPLNDDTDEDGILDGEEVILGEDGWITNPVLWDTDGDHISDFNEINGITPCGDMLNPTNRDTDGDGYWDNVDKYLGNMLLEIRIDDYYLKNLKTGHTVDNGIFS